MKIRHQIDAPHIEQETKSLMRRIRDNRWTPVVVMAAFSLATVRACNKETTVIINNYVGEVQKG